MAWTELRERNGSNQTDLKEKVMMVKSLIMEICEDIDRNPNYGERMNYMDRGGQNYGERRAWRVEEDDRYGERMPYNQRRY